MMSGKIYQVYGSLIRWEDLKKTKIVPDSFKFFDITDEESNNGHRSIDFAETNPKVGKFTILPVHDHVIKLYSVDTNLHKRFPYDFEGFEQRHRYFVIGAIVGVTIVDASCFGVVIEKVMTMEKVTEAANMFEQSCFPQVLQLGEADIHILPADCEWIN